MKAAVVDQPWIAPADLRLKLFSTMTICFGSLLVYVAIPSGVPELDVYRFCAYTLLVVLGIALVIEGMAGIRTLARVDIVTIWTLYFLTFAEFLHPHVRILYANE